MKIQYNNMDVIFGFMIGNWLALFLNIVMWIYKRQQPSLEEFNHFILIAVLTHGFIAIGKDKKK